MDSIDNLLDKNEKILWRGKPKFWPFFLPSLTMLPFGLFWLAVSSVFVYLLVSTFGAVGFLLPHFWIGIYLILGIPLYTALVYRYVDYALTDKRIMIRRGLIGRDFKIIDYDKVQDVYVRVGITDRFFNTGDIVVTSASSIEVISDVEKPYEIFKMLKETLYDIKTDIEFPNKYRPNVNPGYRTTYNPGKK